MELQGLSLAGRMEGLVQLLPPCSAPGSAMQVRATASWTRWSWGGLAVTRRRCRQVLPNTFIAQFWGDLCCWLWDVPSPSCCGAGDLLLLPMPGAVQASTRLQPQKGLVDLSVRAELQPHAVRAPPDLHSFALLSKAVMLMH